MSEHLSTSRTVRSELLGTRYLPIMVTRLMLSLRKAATPQEEGWSFGESMMRFAEPRPVIATGGGIHRDTCSNGSVGTRSQV